MEIFNRILLILSFSSSTFAASLSFSSSLAHNNELAKNFYQHNSSYFQKNHPEILSTLIRQYGRNFSEEVINLWTNDLAKEYNNDLSCEQWIGSCDFYLCQEKKNKCGALGYNLGFGYKYCSGSRFWLDSRMTSSLGHQWVNSVFQCLQRKNFEHSEKNKGNLTCSDIKQSSFDSHPDCYVNSGFCELLLIDQSNIMRLIKKELFSMGTIIQGIRILEICHERTSHE